jgi:hypothetical protein
MLREPGAVQSVHDDDQVPIHRETAIYHSLDKGIRPLKNDIAQFMKNVFDRVCDCGNSALPLGSLWLLAQNHGTVEDKW